MVGKPNLPPDVDERQDMKGAAHPGPGLGALDQERAASMADEGGAAGAVVEAESEEDVNDPTRQPEFSYEAASGPYRRGRRLGASLALAAIGGIVSYALIRRWRS